MIDWTNTHFRVFLRSLVPQALLYTEMQTIHAIKHNSSRALEHSVCEYPLALQLGGSEQEGLVYCALLAEEAGFAEVNLNVGCPSDRVLSGQFGACLMAKPEEVASFVEAMKKRVSIPITVKTRIGIDNQDSYDFFAKFVHSVVNAGCDKLIVHARKAWLSGLSPKQNRTIPPINYDFVYKIKQELPSIPVIINGNIETSAAISEHLTYVEGVMLGRLACNNPYALKAIHNLLYKDEVIKKRSELVVEYRNYLESQVQLGTPLSVLLKPLYNLAHGLANANNWKKHLMAYQQTKQEHQMSLAIEFLKETE